ncbi:MAG TPA: hypothetical protein VD837_07005 [Terriglobales bacterium]|nr:hypothetical protein [Terriglobales bacterium]
MIRAFLIVSLAIMSSHAATVRLTWNRSTDPSVTGYYVYAFTNQVFVATNPAALRVNVGTNIITAIDGLKPVIHHFTATAYNALGVESDFSNVVSTEIPHAPAQMRTLTLQYSADLSSTNWQDKGFFRIKIE